MTKCAICKSDVEEVYEITVRGLWETSISDIDVCKDCKDKYSKD